jgi:hypothetical protein
VRFASLRCRVETGVGAVPSKDTELTYARLIFQILRCDLTTAFRTTTIKEIAMANRQNMESPMRTKKTYLKIEISIATTSTYLNASKTGLDTPPRVRFLRSQGSTANSQSSCF